MSDGPGIGVSPDQAERDTEDGRTEEKAKRWKKPSKPLRRRIILVGRRGVECGQIEFNEDGLRPELELCLDGPAECLASIHNSITPGCNHGVFSMLQLRNKLSVVLPILNLDQLLVRLDQSVQSFIDVCRLVS